MHSQEECPFSSPARVRESPLFSWNATFEPHVFSLCLSSLLFLHWACVWKTPLDLTESCAYYYLQSVRLEPRATKRSTLTCCPDPDTVRTRGSATVSPHQELSIPGTKFVNIGILLQPSPRDNLRLAGGQGCNNYILK